MSSFKISRGYDIPVPGAASRKLVAAPPARTVALRPGDFRGVKPRLLVHEGDRVSAGTPLFADKERPEIVFGSPGGGEVVEIRRGKRRLLLEIVVKLDAEEPFAEGPGATPAQMESLTREQIVDRLLGAGLWPVFRQRPFSNIPDPAVDPAGIFVSASDTSPLPHDPNLALVDREEDFRLGLGVLRKLTSGQVHVGLHSRTRASGSALANLAAVSTHTFDGPHPSGQAEVQIHHALPHKPGQVVWYLDAQDVAAVGECLRSGRYPVTRVIAVGGEGAENRVHYRTRRGVPATLLTGTDSTAHGFRTVSGTLLSGSEVTPGAAVGFHDATLCVIPEGTEPEFAGWMKPGFSKVSRFRAYASALVRSGPGSINTNLGGGVRAHVMTGVHEDVCATGLYPAQLMKSVLAEDVEETMKLGLLDCAECGLCTFVCPSKIEFGRILGQAIEECMREG
ncbi:MAG: NADH:ubiquinone reductase (Na(+)-transporting) subunit A [Gemmatimonadota bacterium]|jgi:Na+-transporting NADH:ubiquinone oxidoreductase subunit A|nr:NADH:ubiquinone reductase (Na(+)-transporting) subunit A [Gemmatimonadota bacterium]MDP6529329.1 NADH:ubiquinone reductase (Na(+)-transporting) subunit A [Gemmatimonadota bacterium]MDP6803647.1 NADH:ubiquinone reductase (Na(+)-transporting) subunit A [Gemmatimonadota bacterium]